VNLARRVKPISYLKAHAPEIVRELADGGEPLVVTVHGEAKAVLQDIASYERQQQTLALFKLLALSQQDVDAGRVRPAAEVFADIRRRRGTQPCAYWCDADS
jgi:prevent-host-death family protein